MPIEKRRRSDRERQKRWRRNRLEEGHKQIQLMLTPEAQDVLTREKARTGESFVQIINRAIVHIETCIPRISGEIKVWPPG